MTSVNTSAKTILEFINNELLDGQGEGLTTGTELFQLGILDSFSFVKLITFLGDKFRVQIDLGQIDPDEFSTIEKISQMIARRTAAAGADALRPVEPAPQEVYPFASIYNTTQSPTVGLLFAGNLLRQAPIDTRWFLEQSGLQNYNFAMVSDVFGNGYNDGVSEDFPGFDGIVPACKMLLDRHFPNAETLFTVGASAGAAPAIHVGHALGAKAVCLLGARVARPGQWRERVALTDSVFLSVLGKTWRAAVVSGISDEEKRHLRDAFAKPDVARRLDEVVNNAETVTNHRLLDELVRALGERETDTRYFFYYAESNPTDSYVANRFRGFRNVQLHPISVPEHYAGRDYQGQRLDHFVANILAEQGELERVFEAALQRQ